MYKVVHLPTGRILQTEIVLTMTKGYRVYSMKASSDSNDALFCFKLTAKWRLFMIALKTHRSRLEFDLMHIPEDYGI